MRYRDLWEAPISDYELAGPTSLTGERRPGAFADGTSFDRVDSKLLASEKGRANIIRGFQNTPFNFHVVFTNQTAFDANDEGTNGEVQQQIESYRCGIHDNFGDFKGKPGVITVVVLGNLSPVDRIPMTAWTLAHKIGHSFQDHTVANTQWADQPSTQFVQATHALDKTLKLLGKYAAKAMNLHSKYDIPNHFNYQDAIRCVLTMRSAQKGKLSSDFEVFPEVVAQYLITGKVTFAAPPEFADTANKMLAMMFEALKGKVVVEV